MGHRDYLSADFSSPRRQHNIMAFVGNGFDLQVMSDFESEVDTTYTSFYHFLKLRSFDPDNVILQAMERLRDEGAENWGDVEGVVEELLDSRMADPDDLAEALRRVQAEFSEFLGLAVPSSLLTRLGSASMDRELAMRSLTGFLGDLAPSDYKRMRFPLGIDNFDVYNFLFVNFNYTPLFDDFIYLDQKQFDPLPFKTADRNFQFEGNPRGVRGARIRPKDTFSSYVMTDVVHPHGHQSIPRSLLFGIDEPARRHGNQDKTLRLAKSFWAQNERRYKHLFDDTELFIVFGCSLGSSDRWWWRHIAEALGEQRELIIYWYNGRSRSLAEEDVRQRFFEAAGVEDVGTESVHVVLYDASSSRCWLNTAAARSSG